MPSHEPKPVHPFFSKKVEDVNGSYDQQTATPAEPQQKQVDEDEAQVVKPKRGRPPKRKDHPSKHDQEVPEDKNQLHKPNAFDKLGTRSNGASAVSTYDEPATAEVEANQQKKRKRRKLTPPPQQNENGTWLDQLRAAAASKKSNEINVISEPPTRDVLVVPEAVGKQEDVSLDNEPALPDTAPEVVVTDNPKVTPSPRRLRKPLKLNGAGGFGTPKDRSATHKQEEVESPEAPTPKRGRRKKNKGQVLLILRYGGHDRKHRYTIGGRIDAILAGPRLANLAVEGPPTLKPAVNPSKTAHPFFSSKPSVPTAAVKHVDVRPPTTFTTPGKLRALRNPNVVLTIDEEPFVESRSSRIYKVPGAVDPAWPPKYANHVHLEQPERLETAQRDPNPLFYHKNRRKTRPMLVDPEESLLARYNQNLRIPATTTANYSPLKHPEKTVLSSVELHAEAIEILSDFGADNDLTRHPAVRRMLDTISTTFTPFDFGQCESQIWTTKYVPKASGEVLQADKELRVLREWLASQTVSSTRITKLESALAGRNQDKAKRRKKRRKLDEELDDFIVDDDDAAAGHLRDVSDNEGSDTSTTPAIRSMIQDTAHGSGTSGTSHKSNAILLSGPHGCGKTAAVFAAAKELDFEVFEIGPNNRRSGKDILDRVGDMARYHQVSRSSKDNLFVTPIEAADQAFKTDEEADALPTERSSDQSALTKFFGQSSKRAPEPKPAKVAQPVQPLETKKAVVQQTSIDGSKPSARQKQSLILLEEVDILFAEDKGFWETVLNLAVQSRRPIIMTCNNESRLRTYLEDLSLYAVLRFRKPSPALSSLYLTLIALAEGHLIDICEVRALLEAKDHDLRASLVQLSFWCQMAVGDPKGGLGWYLPRWPAGCDTNSAGQKLRVVSQRTFDRGLDIVNAANSGSPGSSIDDDIALYEACERGLDPSALSDHAFDSQAMRRTSQDTARSPELLKLLRQNEGHMDLASAVDVCCRVGMPWTDDIYQVIDPTQEPLPARMRNDYVSNEQLLDAPSLVDYQSIDADLAIFVHSSIAKQLHSTASSNISLDKQPPSIIQKTQSTQKTLMSTLDPLIDPMYDLCNKRLALDIAPYARSIANFDLLLERHRETMNRPGKKARSSRASRSALEGGQRSKTRRERWFSKDVHLVNVLNTAGSGWPLPLATTPATDRSRESSIDELAPS